MLVNTDHETIIAKTYLGLVAVGIIATILIYGDE